MSDELFTYSVGRRGVSRVRVYERYPGSPIQVEFTGGRRQTLTNMKGIPVTDHSLAVAIANKLSEKMESGKQKKLARDVLGLPETHTLKELLKRYHEEKESDWSEKHTGTQRQIRDWWLERLGPDTDLRHVDDPQVERLVRLYGDEQEWSARTRQKYLRYILAAFRFARRKLKWISESDDLTAVDVPTPESGGPSYNREQMAALFRHAPEVCWRIDLAINVAFDTQSRPEAYRHLRAEDYLGDRLVRFVAEHDKGGKERIAALSQTTLWKLESALRRDEVKASGWLLPDPDDPKRPITYDRLLKLLEEVEDEAEIEKVERRGLYGIKRRAVTEAEAAAAKLGLGDVVLDRQTGVSTQTRRKVYSQDDMAPKLALTDEMDRLRKGA